MSKMRSLLGLETGGHRLIEFRSKASRFDDCSDCDDLTGGGM
jgi:hypothetical protein